MVFLDDEEPDGIRFVVTYARPNYTVICKHPDGRELSESFPCTYEPRFGPDVADVGTAEEVMERLIGKLRHG